MTSKILSRLCTTNPTTKNRLHLINKNPPINIKPLKDFTDSKESKIGIPIYLDLENMNRQMSHPKKRVSINHMIYLMDILTLVGSQGSVNWCFNDVDSAMSGGSIGRRTRCNDKFVKYPYPKNLITNYQKEYHNKIGDSSVLKNKESFNVEKEHKIINPHNMDMSTTNKVVYQPY